MIRRKSHDGHTRGWRYHLIVRRPLPDQDVALVARVLLDAGGGSALRFGESGAQMSQVDVFLFSHFHVDHSGDFPALRNLLGRCRARN